MNETKKGFNVWKVIWFAVLAAIVFIVWPASPEGRAENIFDDFENGNKAIVLQTKDQEMLQKYYDYAEQNNLPNPTIEMTTEDAGDDQKRVIAELTYEGDDKHSATVTFLFQKNFMRWGLVDVKQEGTL